MIVGLCGAGPRGDTACPGKTPGARAPDGPSVDHCGDAPESGRMQPLEGVDLESCTVTKRAARGHADLAEQVVGLRALAAAHLVADGDERVPLRPGVAEPRLVLPRGAPHSAVSGMRAAARQ